MKKIINKLNKIIDFYNMKWNKLKNKGMSQLLKEI